MVQSNDLFWNYVEEMGNESMKCKFCGRPFAPNTSISRIKWHFSGEKGHGVAICEKVPEHIREEALQARPGGDKRQKTTASSSNIGNTIPTWAQEQGNEVEVLVNKAEDDQMMHMDRSATLERRTVDAHETGQDVSQAIDQVGQLDIEKINWEAMVDIAAQLLGKDIEDDTGVSMEVVAGASSSGRLACNKNHEARGDALATCSTMLVGEAFEENANKIWSWLMCDEVSSISIYGMGGVGKTTLVKHIYNQLLDRPHIFSHVYWITVSQDFRISRLQNNIAQHVGVDLSDDDVLHRAFKLSKELKKKQKWVLILDDLWNSFNPAEVGVPIDKKGCKLIFTTRSLKVCRQMGCLHKIKVEPLSQEEGWTLFMEKLKHDVVLSPEVEQIAKCVARECAGLPLGIVTTAGSLRGIDDIHEWRNTFKKLKESKVWDTEHPVFQLLKFSYDQLDDLALQQCFLYCALFPEDEVILREDLIGYLIDEGMIEGMDSRQEEFDEGHTMLNKLENVCLLERFHGFAVKMHDLIRDMALQIQQENSQVMVKAGDQLKKLPDIEKWKDNLLRVSLMDTQLNQIPRSHSPRCPNLSTLLLCNNQKLRFIGDPFFKQLCGLKVLDLSYTNIENLPDSISNLVTLNALLLKACQKLWCVPSLKKLKALRRLDLHGSSLGELPEDMHGLSNIRYLRLNGCGQNEFPIGILPKLSHLQVLVIDELWMHGEYSPASVKGKEIACLRNLETLECHFEHLSDLVEYVHSRDPTQSLSEYLIAVGEIDDDDYEELDRYGCKTVWLSNLSISRDQDFLAMLPDDIKELLIFKCTDATSLGNVSSSIKYATELEVIEIRDCHSMESLLSPSCFLSAPHKPLSTRSIFSHLKELICRRCKSMKKLLPSVLLPNLLNLECIRVEECEKMEEITARDENEEGDVRGGGSSGSEFNLPKLRSMKLCCLPELKSICGAKLRCDSLEKIVVWKCPKLKRMPISFPILGNGLLSPHLPLVRINTDTREWWESVELDDPRAKDALLPFVSWVPGLILE